MKYVGFWRRFAAYVIDSFIIGAGFYVFILVWALFEIFLISIGLEQKTREIILGVLGVPVYLVIPWLYEAFCLSSKHMATLGKRAAGIIVVDTNYVRLSFGKASVRFWSKIPSAFLLIGFLMAAFTSKKQALHDYLAKTYVIWKVNT